MHSSQQNEKKKHEKTHIECKKMTFFEICFDEISYDTPYLQVCIEKKKCLKIFFLREISSAALIVSVGHHVTVNMVPHFPKSAGYSPSYSPSTDLLV